MSSLLKSPWHIDHDLTCSWSWSATSELTEHFGIIEAVYFLHSLIFPHLMVLGAESESLVTTGFSICFCEHRLFGVFLSASECLHHAVWCAGLAKITLCTFIPFLRNHKINQLWKMALPHTAINTV